MDKLRGIIFAKSLREIPTFALASLNPKTCPNHLLDALADFYSVDFYRNDFLEADKRVLIFNSIELKKVKGTIKAFKKAFSSLGIEADIEEWYSYGGQPFRFKIDLIAKDKEITPKLRDTLTRMIEEYKNVRSIIEEIKLSYRETRRVNINIGGVGEVSVSTEMIDGYNSVQMLQQNFATGGVGETSSYANCLTN